MRNWAIIVAAGSSKRFGGGLSKQYHEVAGRPLLSWTISRFEKADSIDSIIVVGNETELSRITDSVIDPYGFHKVRKVVAGGASRRESVQRGLEALPPAPEMVAIHDGARPLTRPADIDAAVSRALESGASLLVRPTVDTIKVGKDMVVERTLDRAALFHAETPQVFRHQLIVDAHNSLGISDNATDDATLVERMGTKVSLVESTGCNIKVTTPDDLIIVEAMLSRELDG